MVNEISVRASLKIHGKIARKPFGGLWYLCRGVDPQGTGKVEILVPEALTFLNTSDTTFYRWLKDGKEAGAFREYKSIGKNKIRIFLGSKEAVCKKLGITDWQSTTEIPLWQLFNNPDLPLWKFLGIEPNKLTLRQQVTLFQTYWMQKRSIEAAVEAEKKEVQEKRKRRKPCLRKFSGVNGKPTSQSSAGRDIRFLRNKLPIGASQKGIGDSLGITEQTVKEHQRGVGRFQQAHKKKPHEAEAELFYAQKTGQRCPIFKRFGEYYRYGCNLYNLEFTLCSEFTQRLKYKFKLLLEEIPLEAIEWKKNRDTFCTPLAKHFFLTKNEIMEKLNKKYDLDTLDHILIAMYWELKTRSFGKFMIEVKKELRRMKIEEYRRARGY